MGSLWTQHGLLRVGGDEPPLLVDGTATERPPFSGKRAPVVKQGPLLEPGRPMEDHVAGRNYGDDRIVGVHKPET